MNDQNLLTLHCPQCRQLAEVVAEGDISSASNAAGSSTNRPRPAFWAEATVTCALAPEFRAVRLEGIEPRVNAG